MNRCEHYRFIERDYWFRKILSESDCLKAEEIDRLLDESGNHWDDLTFKFFEDESVRITDNHSNAPVHPRDLPGAALDFYIRKRIERIKVNLLEKQLQTA